MNASSARSTAKLERTAMSASARANRTSGPNNW